MPRMTIPMLMLALSSAIPLAQGAEPFVARGEYLAGDPLAYILMDACGNDAQEGIDSNCIVLPAGAGGKHYTLSARDSTGAMLAVSTCYYTADLGFNQCDPFNQRVPQWARYMGVSSLAGVHVQWTYVIQM
jgi:hypothetical protein